MIHAMSVIQGEKDWKVKATFEDDTGNEYLYIKIDTRLSKTGVWA